MADIDRLNRLLRKSLLPEIIPEDLYAATLHAPAPGFTPYINALDRRSGLDTQGRQVGARLALLERHMPDSLSVYPAKVGKSCQCGRTL